MNTSIGTSAGRPAARNLLGEAHAAEDFHGARVAALHLRQALRRVLALDQRAAHAAPAEIEREGEPDRSGADDQNLGVHARRESVSSQSAICFDRAIANSRRGRLAGQA